MKTITIQSVKNGVQIADRCFVAERFLDRLKGLIGVTEMQGGKGLLITKCNNVHMWFMKIPLDIVFLGPEMGSEFESFRRVVSVLEGVRPWKLFPVWNIHASDTLELPVGTISRFSISPGDQLRFESMPFQSDYTGTVKARKDE